METRETLLVSVLVLGVIAAVRPLAIFSTSSYPVYTFVPIDLTNLDTLLLWTRSCGEISISLAGQNDFANVSFGLDNGMIKARRCRECQEVAASGGQDHELDCMDFKPFWIRWTNQGLSAGNEHSPGARMLIDSEPPNFPIFYLGLMGSAYWKFDVDVEPCGPQTFERNLVPAKGKLIDVVSFEEFSAPTIAHCIRRCYEVMGCQSVDYNKVTGDCSLFALDPDFNNFVAEENYQTWGSGKMFKAHSQSQAVSGNF